MKIIEEAISKYGKILDGEIIKVDSFVNHQVNPSITNELARYFVDQFKDTRIDKVLTLETSGIPIAYAVASILNVNMVFAKKSKSKIVDEDVYSEEVRSFTRGTVSTVTVSKKYILPNENILVVDDFLAKGNAIMGLYEIIDTADANCAGAAVAIEKGFQNGGKKIRDMGIDLMSLAIIESMTDDSLTFASQD